MERHPGYRHQIDVAFSGFSAELNNLDDMIQAEVITMDTLQLRDSIDRNLTGCDHVLPQEIYSALSPDEKCVVSHLVESRSGGYIPTGFLRSFSNLGWLR